MNYNLQKINNRKKLIIGVSILFCTVILIFGVTTAFFTQSNSKNTDDIVTSNVTLDYNDNKNYMRNNIIPVVESDVTKFASKNLINSTDEIKYTDEDICHYKDDMYACSLYEFTITNTASISQNIIVSMTPIINEYNNLYFILYESKVNEINNDLSMIEKNTKIENSTINFNNTNIILKPNDSKTYTIVFYIKNLDEPQDDANKKFTASILVNSITTGYKKIVQLGEGCYEFETLEDNTLKLTKFKGINHETGEVTESCGVTKDDDGFYSVEIPSKIGDYNISTLGNTLFSAVNTLEDGTITGVNQFINIEKVTINEGITTIEDGFVDIENMKGYGTFLGIGCDVVTQQPIPDRTLEVILPNSLKHIGDIAFFMTALRELEIPASVEKIGFGTFNSNYNLTTLIFEENSSLTTIGDLAFYSNNILSIKIPNTVQTIGEYAFSNNPNLTILEFEENSSLTTIGEGAFSYNNISSLIIPRSLESIGKHAFISNKNLESLTFENNSNLHTIGYGAFYNNNIKSLIIPSGVQTIEKAAFKTNKNLINLEFEKDSNLHTIGEEAFNDCNLTYKDPYYPLVIPSGVNSIERLAFTSNSNLKYIKFIGTLNADNPSDWYGNNTILIPSDDWYDSMDTSLLESEEE